jgi:hypothetical protein
MENSKFIGQAWADEYGITASIKIEDLKRLIESGEFPLNKYGEVRIRVGKLAKPNERSKATHFVRMYEYKSEF